MWLWFVRVKRRAQAHRATPTGTGTSTSTGAGSRTPTTGRLTSAPRCPPPRMRPVMSASGTPQQPLRHFARRTNFRAFSPAIWKLVSTHLWLIEAACARTELAEPRGQIFIASRYRLSFKLYSELKSLEFISTYWEELLLVDHWQGGIIYLGLCTKTSYKVRV